MNKYIVYIFILLFGQSRLISGPANILEEFKKRIGFPVANAKPNVELLETEAIILGIPDMNLCPTFQVNWEKIDDSITIDHFNKIVDKHLYYAGSPGKIFIDFTYSLDTVPIEFRLFDYVASISKYPIPGERGPSDIGDFSIQLVGGAYSELRFIRKNIFVSVTAEPPSTISVYNISRWIQSQFLMQARNEVQEKCPRPSREIIGQQSTREGQALLSAKAAPLQGKVGEPITINIEMPTGIVTNNYLIREYFDNERFRSTRVNGLLSIIPTKPGHGSFGYMVINKSSLLFSIYEFAIDVRP